MFHCLSFTLSHDMCGNPRLENGTLNHLMMVAVHTYGPNSVPVTWVQRAIDTHELRGEAPCRLSLHGMRIMLQLVDKK